MELDQLLQKFKPQLKKHFIPIILGLSGFVLLLYGLIGMVASNSSSPEDIVFESSDEKGQKEEEIVVDVSGEVISPGVYKLSSNSRIKDALVKAGGLSGNANREWVEKNLNLAKKVADGMKIYIPGEGSKSSESSEGSKSNKGSGNENIMGSSISSVNINSANQAELEELPGIGPVTAGKIIENRPYGSIEELIERKVVGNSVFEKIKDKISY